MPRFARLEARAVHDVRPGLQRMTLSDGSEAYALTNLCGDVSQGDELLVNVTAVDLGLGTGGAHVVHANLTAPGLGVRATGRVMKARYLSEQLAVEVAHVGAEDAADAFAAGTLQQIKSVRVAVCVLHSHAMALAATLYDATGNPPGYVMTDGGALPFVLSDLAATCLERGVIATAVSTGQAFGAPMEAVTVASGVAALAQRGIDRVVIGPGPGHLGSGDALGFSGLDLAGHASVIARLGASAAVVVRASLADERIRHFGVSHHSRTLAAASSPETVVPVPTGLGAFASDVSDRAESQLARDAAWMRSLGPRAVEFTPLIVEDALERTGLAITTMGRPLGADAYACAWVGACASWLSAET